jgi:hypothetical protein
MSFMPPIHEGTITSKPFPPPHGTIHGGQPRDGGTLLAESPESSAVAELNSLIAALGSLSAQAQNLPLTPPAPPGVPNGQTYRPQTTDYAQFADDSN